MIAFWHRHYLSVYIQTSNNNVVITQFYRLILMGSDKRAQTQMELLLEKLDEDGLVETVAKNIVAFVR